jgi:RimJ/RimL family protein N-acetyltransferase
VNVTLRPVEAADLPVFFEHQNDPVACERVGWTPRDRAAFDAHWRRIMINPDSLLRTVLVDGEVAGNVVSWSHDGRRDVGYWLGREFWGRGVGPEALRLFLDVETTRPLYADPLATNAASVAVLRRCGFVEAGRDGDHLVMVKEG